MSLFLAAAGAFLRYSRQTLRSYNVADWNIWTVDKDVFYDSTKCFLLLICYLFIITVLESN